MFLLFAHAFKAQSLAQLNKGTLSDEEYAVQKNELLKNGKVVPLTIFDGDSMPYISLATCKVEGEHMYLTKKEKRRFKTLERRVKKVYPYAREARIRLRLYNDTLMSMKNELQRKAYMKKAEKEIKKEFFKDLQNLTISEGRILIRLIDRETGDTSYELLKELRGAMSAVFWQTLAKLWGNDLKTKYDPTVGEDKLIEQIIINLENGAYD